MLPLSPLSRCDIDAAWCYRNKTLAGGNRAERNDSILVHKFTEKGYVCPDKFTKADKDKKANDAARLSKKKAVKKAKEEGTELEETSKVEASKEKYKGGLVFDPVKGLYDTFILALDFNSLYPSIIQEYDIDFTTIDWTAEDVSHTWHPLFIQLLTDHF